MEIWQNFLSSMEREFGAPVIDKWLRSLKIVSFDAGNIYLEARDSFQISWFEEHIRPRLHLNSYNHRPIKVHLKIASSAPAPTLKKESTFQITPNSLDPTMTLDNFSVTPANKMAHSLMSDFPSPFNPIFLFGPKNSGKTHLLNGAALYLQNAGKKVFFVQASTFTEHVVQAIRLGMMQEFRKIYRDIDVLIVDNIQIFSKKAATQEEFFHTFNTLHTQGKTILLSADVAPSQLKEIEPRLMSRFEWGISVGLERVDSQTVFDQKAALWKMDLNLEAKNFLLENFEDPVQALQLLSMRASGKVTAVSAQALLKDMLVREERNAVTHETIIQHVANHFGMKSEDLTGKSQQRECVVPRQIAMYLCREKLKLPYQQIGQIFGRDHSTVMSSVKLVGSRGDLIDRLKEIKSLL
jgi:chromosomal replication initiator protein